MKICLAFILILSSVFCFGQSYSSVNKKAIKLFEQAKLAYGSNLYSKSLKLLDDAIALDSTFLEVYLMKSDIYQVNDSFILQIRSLESARRLNISKFPKLYYNLGNAYYRSGFYMKAAESYHKYLDITGEKVTFIVNTKQNIDSSLFQ